MMSLRSWIGLLMVYVLYLLLGGWSFRALEAPAECQRKQSQKDLFRKTVADIKGNLTQNQTDHLYHFLTESHSKSADAIITPTSTSSSFQYIQEDSMSTCSEKWDFYNSFVFSFTASTTIGYGQLSPITWQGKLLCIFYSLIGIPINGILIGSLGTYFASKLLSLKRNKSQQRSEFGKIVSIFLDVLMSLIPGIVFFMLGPAAIFQVVEHWSYFDSLYFTFITLTTIGFGDFAAGRNSEALESIGPWKLPYEIFIIVWIIFGLGYLFMIITIISDGIRKPVRQAVKKIVAAEKSIMCKIIQELVIMKQKQKDFYGSEKPTMIRRGSEPSLSSTVDPDDIQDVFTKTGSPEMKRARSLTDLETGTSSGKDRHKLEPEPRAFISGLDKDTIASLRKFFDNYSLKVSRSPSLISEIEDNRRVLPRRAISVQHPPNMITNRLNSGVETPCRRSSMRLPSDSSSSHTYHYSPNGLNLSTPKTPSIKSAGYRRMDQSICHFDVGGVEELDIANISLPEILRTTTLEEFLTAAQKVEEDQQKNEDLEDMNVRTQKISFSGGGGGDNSFSTTIRKMSNIRKISNIFSGSKIQPKEQYQNQQQADHPPKIIVSREEDEEEDGKEEKGPRLSVISLESSDSSSS